MVQWLGLHASNAGDPGSFPGQGIRSHMPQQKSKIPTETRHSQINKIKKKKKKTCKIWELNSDPSSGPHSATVGKQEPETSEADQRTGDWPAGQEWHVASTLSIQVLCFGAGLPGLLETQLLCHTALLQKLSTAFRRKSQFDILAWIPTLGPSYIGAGTRSSLCNLKLRRCHSPASAGPPIPPVHQGPASGQLLRGASLLQPTDVPPAALSPANFSFGACSPRRNLTVICVWCPCSPACLAKVFSFPMNREKGGACWASQVVQR